MTKTQAVSPDFVSRQEAVTRLMLSLRQVDRLLSQGVLVRTKVSTNLTGIPRASFEAYLAGRAGPAVAPQHLPMPELQRPTIEPQIATGPPAALSVGPTAVVHFSPEQRKTIIDWMSSILAR